MLYIICIILSIIICFSFIIIYKKKQDKITQRFLQQCETKYANEKRKEIDQKIEKEYQDKKQQIFDLEQFYINYKDAEKKHIDNELRNYSESKNKEIEEQLKETLANYNQQADEAQQAITKLQNSLKEFQLKQEAVNAEILRRRELEEKEDFYKICISEESLADIEILKQVKKKLKKPEFIDKMIYDNYVSKPVLEMEKRVLQNTSFSGIYKITCLTTGEIYIGKSADIKTRWQQHCKSAFNCGTIASSLLHTKMKKYGVENFTFELLEKVPKENLSEREKYYINFYQTKEVGLNERNG